MKKPNVILMFVDDLGYGDISCFNENSKIRTPAIDALAESGMRFTDSHACSAVCTPSRYGLLTGRYSWRSRLKQMVLPGESETLIEHDRMTLAHLFKRAGYHTACVGKWHLGLDWTLKEKPEPADFNAPEEYYADLGKPVCGRNGDFDFRKERVCEGLDIDYTAPIKFGPNQYGFDYFFGMPASLDQPPFVYIENDHVVEQPAYLSGEMHLDRRTASMQQQWQLGPIAPSFDHRKVLPDMNDKVLELIDAYAQTDEPFFIYYPTPAVHGPLLPTKEFEGKSKLNAYADVVMMVDDMVRQIMEKLEQRGLANDTVFIFTSDNGCSGVADYPALLEKGHNPSYIFRGKKTEIYEGGHRVPTIVHYPACVPANTTCGETVCHTDFFRTFGDLLNLPVEDSAAEDSVSNLPLWKGGQDPVRESTVYTSVAGCFAIQQGPWKLELCETAGMFDDQKKIEDGQYAFQLYHMQEDICETENLIDKYPERAEEMKRALLDIVQRGRSTPGTPQKNTGPDYWSTLEWQKSMAER